MRVAVDTRYCAPPQSGVGRVARELVLALLEADDGPDVVTFGEAVAPRSGRLEPVPLSGPKRRLLQGMWKTLGWPSLDRLLPAVDLVHFTAFTALPTSRPHVVTIPDLAWIHHPDTLEKRNLAYLRQAVPASLASARRIVAHSEFGRRDLVESLGVEAERIAVIPHGVRMPAASLPGPSVGESLGIPSPFLLAVGTLEPRKNLRFLIEVVGRLAGSPRLVLAGAPGWGDDGVDAAARRAGISDRVHRLGHVDDATLDALYREAVAFCFPSRFEGFGLPVAEAMARGCPVVSSDRSALPETVGAAGVLLSPDDSDAWTETLDDLLENETRRRELARLGRKRAAELTWEAAARRTLAVYREALSA